MRLTFAGPGFQSGLSFAFRPVTWCFAYLVKRHGLQDFLNSAASRLSLSLDALLHRFAPRGLPFE
jgi:hypothetical protein